MNIKEFTTESGKKIQEALKNKGIIPLENDTIAFGYTEHELDGYISYNYSSTGIKFLLKDLDETDLQKDDIKIWRTWTFKG